MGKAAASDKAGRKILGGYEIVAEIAEGGMGTVLLAVQTSLGRAAVLKKARRDLVDQPSPDVFRREGQVKRLHFLLVIVRIARDTVGRIRARRQFCVDQTRRRPVAGITGGQKHQGEEQREPGQATLEKRCFRH